MTGPISTKMPKDKSVERDNGRPQKRPHRTALAGPQADILALQGAAGNRTVSQWLQSGLVNRMSKIRDPQLRVENAVTGNKGHPIDPATRSFMEENFGQDFSRVRIYADREAATSAAALNADAYTTGDHIVFGAGQYSPETSTGRRLLAHELTHIVQQQAAGGSRQSGVSNAGDPFESQAHEVAKLVSGSQINRGQSVRQVLAINGHGVPPAVQRREHDYSHLTPVERQQMDSLLASLTEAMHSGPEYSGTSILIEEARSLQRTFLNPPGPRTELAAAQALLGIHRILSERARTAQRDTDGALMYTDISGQRPWTAQRPQRVEDIPIFSSLNVQRWLSTAVTLAPTVPVRERRRRARRRSEARPTPAAETVMAETTPVAAEPPAPRTLIGTAVQESRALATEETTPGTLGPEIRRGLTRLRSVTVSQAMEALSERIREVDEGSGDQRGPSIVHGRNASLTLLRASGRILYLANRIYVVDRSGHIVPGEFEFNLKGISGLRRGGVYFFGRFALGREGSQSRINTPALIQLSGSRPRVVSGDIFPRNVLTDWIPLQQQIQATLRQNGVGIIVSRNYTTRQLTFTRDFSTRKVRQAIQGAADHLPWAIRTRLRQMGQDPAGEIFSQALNLGLSEVARRVPHIAALMAVYQALETTNWIGNLMNIAAYARSRDEINIVSQAMARRLANEIVDRLIGGVVSAGRRAIGPRQRSASSSGGTTQGQPAPPSSSQTPSPARPAAPQRPHTPSQPQTPQPRPVQRPTSQMQPTTRSPRPPTADRPAQQTQQPRQSLRPIEGGGQTTPSRSPRLQVHRGGRSSRPSRPTSPPEPDPRARQRSPANQLAQQPPQPRQPLRAIEGGGQTTPPRTGHLRPVRSGEPPTRPQPPRSQPARQLRPQVAEEPLAATGTEGPMVQTPRGSSQSAGVGRQPTIASGGGSGQGGSGQPPPSRTGRPATAQTTGQGGTTRQPAQQETSRPQRGEHAQQRRTEGRRVGPANNDAQRARQADVFRQPDGRYVVRGPRGREHIFEADGTHVTSIDRSRSAHQLKVQRGERTPVSAEEFGQFQEIFR